MILNAEYSGIHPLAKAFLHSADWHLLCGNFSIFHELGAREPEFVPSNGSCFSTHNFSSGRSQLGKTRKLYSAGVFCTPTGEGSLFQYPAMSHKCRFDQMSIRQNSRTWKFSQPVKRFAVTSPLEEGYTKRDSIS